MGEQYQYSSLASSSQIRLLHLHPNKNLLSPCVRCDIVPVDLNATPLPSYEALSYVWGSNEKPFRVACDKRSSISVTASLYHALRDLRLENEIRTLWADAICINQADVPERNGQVLLMDRVYKGAKQVVTYVGEGTDERYLGILLAQQLCDLVAKTFPKSPDPRMQNPERYTELGLPHRDDPRWGYLHAVFSLPWSSRMWIVQESTLNENMVMMCGRLVFPWSMLGDLEILASQDMVPRLATAPSAPDTFGPSDVIESRPSPTGIMSALRKAAKFDYLQHETLQLLLQKCHTLGSTDPRDKVYALFNIAKDREALGIVPDYGLPVAHVYIDVAVRILKADSHLDLLSSVFGKKSVSVPSWVPDWTQTGYSLLEATVAVRNGLYCASGTTRSDVKYDKQLNAITISGAIVDRIAKTMGKVWPTKLQRKPAWIEDQVQMAADLPAYGTAKTGTNAFWRTLVANLVQPEGLSQPSEATDDYGKYFQAYVKLQNLLAQAEAGNDVSIRKEEHDMALAFQTSMIRVVASRSLCTTEGGYLVMAPVGVERGDCVCILSGGKLPYIVRAPKGEEEPGMIEKTRWHFIGDAYVHGLMKGEATRRTSLKFENIVLV